MGLQLKEKIYGSDRACAIGRYPYLVDADIFKLIPAIQRLFELPFRAVVPGHGPLCGGKEIQALLDYLETSLKLAQEHLAKGHGEEETAVDANFPIYGDSPTGKWYERNIRIIYRQARMRK